MINTKDLTREIAIYLGYDVDPGDIRFIELQLEKAYIAGQKDGVDEARKMTLDIIKNA